MYEALATFGEDHEFNLTEITKWSRDWLAQNGIDVGRTVFGYVVRGALSGGVSLKDRPGPTADEIAGAFLRSTLARGAAAQLLLTREETQVVSEWLGAPAPTDEL